MFNLHVDYNCETLVIDVDISLLNQRVVRILRNTFRGEDNLVNNINIENSEQVVEDIVSNLNSCGFYCLENVLSDDLQKEFTDEVIKLLKSKGKRYFSVVNVMSDEDLAFKAISKNNELTSLLTSVAKVALKKEVSKSDSLSVLRVVTGKKADTQSLKFHYDAFALTALIPIIIPDGPLEKAGHLVAFPNLRKLRSMFFSI
tara:strand:- start:1111 stop:1713 length:603 start_codon:yes stop_codon:yes gene_type:complete